jgi:hypothetical protein
MRKPYYLFCLLVSTGLLTNAQKKTPDQPPIIDTVKPVTYRPAAQPRPYKDVITAKAITQDGLFTVHKVNERYFFEIADSLLGRDILVVNRLAKTSTAFSVSSASAYAGDIINEKQIRFDKSPNNKIFLRTISYSVYSRDSTKPMYRSVSAGIHPITAAFDIKALNTDDHSTVIDLTDYINTDNDILGFDSRSKSAYGLGSQAQDRSYIVNVRSYPRNTELRMLRTYSRSGSGTATIEINSSILLLPKEPMKGRHADERVGYFTTGFTDFDANPQGVKSVQLATRWRLEPKEQDVKKYLAGELVEPAKPIVIYIDPATPEKWIPYLIQGINDWQQAFEGAGFKNAIIGKRAPTKEEDSTWSLEDARFSALVYKPSTVANASGPQVHDPRSGEILETHINWYHNVMSLLHSWYFVQAAAIDPRARKMQFDDELMGRLIRFVSCHEVGHTLGLRHNFAASSTVPVECLRDKAWVEAHGHTPSIMDYARFNYVAQPEDSISSEGIMPRIGAYDKWAIEWGYKWMPQFKTAKEEESFLNEWVVKKLDDSRLLFTAEGSTGLQDPRTQMEDLGDDAMKASGYGIKNLKRILANLPQWTYEPNDPYDNLDQMYDRILYQFGNYIGHVTRNIGGTFVTPKTVEQKGVVYESVPLAKQCAAMEFLNQHIFETPVWLLDKELMKITGKQPLDIISAQQSDVLSTLLNKTLLERLSEVEVMDPVNSYKLTDFLNDLKNYVWVELRTNKPVDVYRRSLQKLYVEKLKTLIGRSGSSDTGDMVSVTKAHIKSLRSAIKTRLQSPADEMTRYHLEDLLDRTNEMLGIPTAGK